MPRGGARNRSGPQPDPSSGRSERRGFKLTALPSEGYQDDPPEWPLGASTSESATGDRELQIWVEAWRTPQACAWSMQAWRWPIVAEYCRIKALVELSAATSASLVSQLHRYRDQIGLTPAGLKENGWTIAQDEVGEKREAATSASSDEPVYDPRAELKALRGGA